MQPTSGSPQYPTQAGYGAPNEPAGRPGFAPQPVEVGLTRVRPWAVAGTGAVVMLVLIGAIGNQKVSDEIVKHELTASQDSFWNIAVRSLLTFAWRFSPRAGVDIGRIWIASVIFVVLSIVLTLLFTYALARGKRSFGGAFFATWAAAVFAVEIAAYVRAAIADLSKLTGQQVSKPVAVVFGQYSPTQSSAFVALLFGFVAALVAGFVGAVSSTTNVLLEPSSVRTPFEAEPAGAPPASQQPEPQQAQAWAAPPPPGPISSSSPSPWTESRVDTTKRDEPQPTAVLPVVDEPRRENTTDSQATTQFPAWPPRDERPAEGGSAPESESTQAYRVPIDGDEPESDATQAYRLPHDDDNEQQPRRES